MPSLSIGQLARRAGVAVDTVRYYERNNLLFPAGRLVSGYRRYGDIELKRLRFIRRAKALGFTLADIRDLLSLSEQRSVPKIKRRPKRSSRRSSVASSNSSTSATPFGHWWRPAPATVAPLPVPSSTR